MSKEPGEIEQLDVDLMQRWQVLQGEVLGMVQRAEVDPEFRARLDLDVESPSIPLFGGPGEADRTRRLDENPKHRILEACARKLIPPIFDWEVMPAFGGHAYLVLKGIKSESDV